MSRRSFVTLGLLAALALGVLRPAGAEATRFETKLVSRASGPTGVVGDWYSHPLAITPDGRTVLFESGARNLDPADGESDNDIYVRDLVTETTTLVSRATGLAGAKAEVNSSAVGMTQDGRKVLFHTLSRNLDGEDAMVLDVFVRDVLEGTTTLVSRASGAAGAKGNGHSYAEAITPDGRWALFRSQATNLGGHGGTFYDVYARDLETHRTVLVSRASGAAGEPANAESNDPVMTPDGRHVLFNSVASNLGDPEDPWLDVFVRDLETDTTTHVSHDPDPDAPDALDDPAGHRRGLDITSDGTRVLYVSGHSAWGPEHEPPRNLLLRDLEIESTTLVSRASGASGAPGDGNSGWGTLTPDGTKLLFTSSATNLDPADTDAMWGAYVRDLPAQTTMLVSRLSGANGETAQGAAYARAITPDGRRVLFQSSADNMAPGHPKERVFVRDTRTHMTTLVSRASGFDGEEPESHSSPAAITPNGRWVLFGASRMPIDGSYLNSHHQAFVRTVLESPESLSPPQITGQAVVGKTLTCSAGEWTDGEITRAWRRGEVAVPGESGETYTVRSVDVGEAIDCVVTATNELGAASERSNAVIPSEPVDPEPDDGEPAPASPQEQAVSDGREAQGPAGPSGPWGPPNETPAQEPAPRLLVALITDRARTRAGRRVVFRYAATGPGALTLDLLRHRLVMARVRGRTRGGRGTIRWNGLRSRRARGRSSRAWPAPGVYRVRLTIRGTDGQVHRDGGWLRISATVAPAVQRASRIRAPRVGPGGGAAPGPSPWPRA